MNAFRIITLLCLGAAPLRASLIDGLLAYYDFEETGTAGLANKAPGATQYDAALSTGTFGLSGPGFAGNAAFNPGDGLSDRSVLLAGNALNVADFSNQHVVVPIGSSMLGGNFTISVWHNLTPGAGNTSARFFVFEPSAGFDVSWGTGAAVGAGDSYLSYVGQVAGQSATLDRNQWHLATHVFAVNGTDTELSTYVNGNLLGTRTAATSLLDFPSLFFGDARAGTSPDRDWDGMLDEVAIWNRALDANEVSALHNLGLAGQPLTSVPEPSTVSLLMAGLALAFRRCKIPTTETRSLR